jgi:hypothetical protein
MIKQASQYIVNEVSKKLSKQCLNKLKLLFRSSIYRRTKKLNMLSGNYTVTDSNRTHLDLSGNSIMIKYKYQLEITFITPDQFVYRISPNVIEMDVYTFYDGNTYILKPQLNTENIYFSGIRIMLIPKETVTIYNRQKSKKYNDCMNQKQPKYGDISNNNRFNYDLISNITPGQI